MNSATSSNFESFSESVRAWNIVTIWCLSNPTPGRGYQKKKKNQPAHDFDFSHYFQFTAVKGPHHHHHHHHQVRGRSAEANELCE